jgi:NitT/TauT family transport system permease protein
MLTNTPFPSERTERAVETLPARSLRLASGNASLISFVLLLAILEVVLTVRGTPDYVFPAPHKILYALYAGFALPFSAPQGFYVHIVTTLTEAVVSFVLGSAVGVALGTMVIQFTMARRIVLPYVMALQSLPKVALAPLFVVWFGLGMTSKIVLGILLTSFPLLINTIAGLGNVDQDRIDLMKSLRASPWKTFRLVRLPSALPFIFAGLEMAAVYAVLGAVVGEFVGGQTGLGVLILNRNAVLDIAGALAALVLLGVMGVSLQKTVAAVRRRFLFWAPSSDRLTAKPEV